MIFENTSKAYLGLLKEILENFQYKVSPRGFPCRETLDVYFTITAPDSRSLSTGNPERDKTLTEYYEAEKKLYLAGERRAKVWGKEASKFWLSISNPDGTINSNYGWLIFHNRSLPDGLTPWEWAKESLVKDQNSRQAFVRFSLPEHQWFKNKDQVCTMHANFVIREDKLHMTTVMRSNDLWVGLPYDMPWFCFLQEKMADQLSVEVGRYNHFVHSMHLYEKDVSKAIQLLRR